MENDVYGDADCSSMLLVPKDRRMDAWRFPSCARDTAFEMLGFSYATISYGRVR